MGSSCRHSVDQHSPLLLKLRVPREPLSHLLSPLIWFAPVSSFILQLLRHCVMCIMHTLLLYVDYSYQDRFLYIKTSDSPNCVIKRGSEFWLSWFSFPQSAGVNMVSAHLPPSTDTAVHSISQLNLKVRTKYPKLSHPSGPDLAWLMVFLAPQRVDLGLGEERTDCAARGLQVRKDSLHKGIWGLRRRRLLLVLGYCQEVLLSNMFTFSEDSVTCCC